MDRSSRQRRSVPARASAGAPALTPRAPAGPAALVLRLQRTAGNRAVEQLLARRPSPPPGGGRTLPAAVQDKMEGAFGTDFSDVRVHVGAQPRELGALAYTRGSDIHFAPGRFDPASSAGQELLGHELAHVIQQRAGASRVARAVVVDGGLEAEADEAGARAARGEPARVEGRSPGEEAVQPKLGFEIEMLVLVDHNGRPIPEKVALGTVGPHLELTVDQNAEAEGPTPTAAAGAGYDLPPGWTRRAAFLPAVGAATVYPTEAAAYLAHPAPLNPGEEIKPAYQRGTDPATLRHPRGPGMGADRYASIVEIVTKPYAPETPTGAANIRQAMTDAAAFAGAIDPHNRVALSTLPHVTAVNPHIHVGNTNSPAQTVNGSIQATLGVDIAQFGAFAESIADPHHQGLFKLKHATEAQEQQGRLVQRELVAAVADARDVVNHIGNTVHRRILPDKQVTLDEVTGLLVLMCQYLRLGKLAYDPTTNRWGLDKNNAPIMSRTDLSTIFRSLPSDQREWATDYRAAIATRLLARTGRTVGSSLLTDPTETQVSQYNITVTAGQFIDRVFTQNDDGVTARFGAIKTMGPEVVKAATGWFGSGERKGAVFEVRNLVPGGGGERFAPASWVTLADYYIALLQTLNARAPATHGALSTTDLGVVDPGRVQVQHAGADVLAGMGTDTDPTLLNAIRGLRPTQTRVTQATV